MRERYCKRGISVEPLKYSNEKGSEMFHLPGDHGQAMFFHQDSVSPSESTLKAKSYLTQLCW